MINIAQLHTEVKKRGAHMTYVKVKSAVDGIPDSTTKDEKKKILEALDQGYKAARENILKS